MVCLGNMCMDTLHKGDNDDDDDDDDDDDNNVGDEIWKMLTWKIENEMQV